MNMTKMMKSGRCNTGEIAMKLMIGATLLIVLAGVPAYAQQDQDKDRDKPKPQQEEPKKQPEKEKPPQERPPQEKDRQQQDRQQQERQQQEKQQAERQRQQQSEQRQQAQRQDADRSRQSQRDAGNTNARRVREEDFRSHFGHEHHFRVARRDDRRFQYRGYWFEYTEPWPVGWSYNDDVYVDEIDGEYYLIDPVHPGIRLLIIVAG
jgi:flagellar motor protein MotB